MIRQAHQASSNARNTPVLDCVGQPISINDSIRNKERARIDRMIYGNRSNVGIAVWAKWMTDETEEDLKRKAVKQKFIAKIAKAAYKLKLRSTDPKLSERIRNNAARKLSAAKAIDVTDTLSMAKFLGVAVSATELRLFK